MNVADGIGPAGQDLSCLLFRLKCCLGVKHENQDNTYLQVYIFEYLKKARITKRNKEANVPSIKEVLSVSEGFG